MLDIRRFAAAHGIPLLESGNEHCHDGWVQLHCPLCDGVGGEWHLGFSIERGSFNCWRCGSLSGYKAIGLLLRTSNEDRIKEVFRLYRMDEKTGRPVVQVVRAADIDPPTGTTPMRAVHRKYLKRRGFDPEMLEEVWGLQATSHLSGRWNWRVVIPIRDSSSRTVAYQGRSIKEGVEPKYLMTEDSKILIDPRSILYGIDKAKKDSVLVVEGGTGVWRLGPGTVATLGIDWKIEQAYQIRQYSRRFLLFDPEPKAQQRAQRLAEWLSYYPGTTEVLDGFRTDPGDFTDKQARRIMQKLGF